MNNMLATDSVLKFDDLFKLHRLVLGAAGMALINEYPPIVINEDEFLTKIECDKKEKTTYAEEEVKSHEERKGIRFFIHCYDLFPYWDTSVKSGLREKMDASTNEFQAKAIDLINKFIKVTKNVDVFCLRGIENYRYFDYDAKVLSMINAFRVRGVFLGKEKWELDHLKKDSARQIDLREWETREEKPVDIYNIPGE